MTISARDLRRVIDECESAEKRVLPPARATATGDCPCGARDVWLIHGLCFWCLGVRPA